LESIMVKAASLIAILLLVAPATAADKAAPAARAVPAAKPVPAKAGGTTAAVAAPGTLPVAEVVKRMQERYEKASDYRAPFTQKYTNAATGRERTSSGELLIKKPGRMRWNYEKPERHMYLASGSTFWVYEPEAKQAFRQDLKSSQLPVAVSFLMGKGKLQDEFDVTLAKELPYGDASAYRLSLKPRKPQSTYKAIYFVVDPASYLVRQSVLINTQGDINSFVFGDARLDGKLTDADFKWTPPPGIKVIDGSQATK
jgi:outer membrane lipoprotein carrier protein